MKGKRGCYVKLNKRKEMLLLKLNERKERGCYVKLNKWKERLLCEAYDGVLREVVVIYRPAQINCTHSSP